MKLKRLVLALAALGVSGGAFALTPLAVNGFNNPNSCSNWIIGGGAAYVQPLGNDLDYANVATFAQSGNQNNSTYSYNIDEQAVDQEYDWGWQGLIDYRFPQTTNDVELNYLHFGDTNDDTTVPAPGSYVYSAGTGNGGSFQPFTSVKGSLDSDIDAANLEFGHTFNDGRLGIRIHGGLQYARISSDLDIYGGSPETFHNGNNQEGDSCQENEVFSSDSDFHGIGPRVGIGATFDLGSGFSVYGDSGIELLVGDLDTDSSAADTLTARHYCNGQLQDTETTTFGANFSGSDQTTVVPGADAEAGLSYTAALGNNVGLTVQGGYMVQGYVHPVRRVEFDGNNNNIGSGVGTSAGCASFSSSLSDFGLQGPYVGLDLSF